MVDSVNNNLLNSLRYLKNVNPKDIHMNVFTKKLTNTPSPFTTNDPKKIGDAFGKALDTLDQMESQSRNKFLHAYHSEVDGLIKLIDSEMNKKIGKIRENSLLKSMGIADKAAALYKKWNEPHIVRPDLDVSEL